MGSTLGEWQARHGRCEKDGEARLGGYVRVQVRGTQSGMVEIKREW